MLASVPGASSSVRLRKRDRDPAPLAQVSELSVAASDPLDLRPAVTFQGRDHVTDLGGPPGKPGMARLIERIPQG